MRSPPRSVRDERKQQTRQRLLDGALRLLEGERSFSSISLREVTRAAGVVPAAFYRHFDDMEALGFALVDEAFATLHGLMREARAAPLPPEHLVRRSVETFLGYVREHPLHFRFIAKERYGGSTRVRRRIREEIDRWSSDLSRDLSAFPAIAHLDDATRDLVAGLLVQIVIGATEQLLELLPDPPMSEESAIHARTELQMLLVLLGSQAWRAPA